MKKNKIKITNKFVGFVVAIIMIALGTIIFLLPELALNVALWIFVFGLLLFGVFQIIRFFKDEQKKYRKLVFGLVIFILGMSLLYSEDLSRAHILAILLAFSTLFSAIDQIKAGLGLGKSNQKKYQWLLVAGVLNICLFVFFIFNPFVHLFATAILSAVYLIFEGVALLLESISTDS